MGFEMKHGFFLCAFAVLCTTNLNAQNLQPNLSIQSSGIIDAAKPTLAFSGAHYDLVNFEIPKGKILIVNISAKGFSPFLEIGNIKAGENCTDCNIGGSDAKGAIFAKYFSHNGEKIQIRISAQKPENFGNYSIDTRLIDYIEPIPKTINFPAKISGKLSFEDANDADFLFKDVYSVKLSKGQIIDIDLKSNSFDPMVEITDPSGKKISDDDNGIGKNAFLNYRASQSGNYKIDVKTNDYNLGEYNLLLNDAKAKTPNSIAPINAGQKIKSQIGNNDIIIENGDKIIAKNYSFTPQKGKSYWLELSSNDFDPMLEFGKNSANGFNQIAIDDDSGKNNSAIILYKAQSTDRLIARIRPSFDNGLKTKLGSYNFSIREANIAPQPNNPKPTNKNAIINGKLQDGGARDVNNFLYDLYALPLNMDDRIIVSANADFDSSIEIGTIKNGKFEAVLKDDDSNGGFNPSTHFRATAAQDYVIKLKANEIQTNGNYQINISPIENPIMPSPTPINLGDEINGNLSINSASFGPKDTPYDLYSFDAKMGETYIISMSSKEFDTLLGIKPDGANDYRENDDARENPSASLIEYSPDKDTKILIRAACFKGAKYGNYGLKITKK